MLLADARREFKKGIDGGNARRRRVSTRQTLRKKVREGQLQKKRKLSNTKESTPSPPEYDVNTLVYVQEIPKYAHTLRSTVENTQEGVTRVLEALRFFRNLLRKQEPPTNEVLAAGILQGLFGCLGQTAHHALAYEASWCLVNIVAGTTEQTTTAIKAGAVPVLVNGMRYPDAKVSEMCAQALANIAVEGAEFRNMLISLGTLDVLIRAIESLLMLFNAGRVLFESVSALVTLGCAPTIETAKKIAPCLVALLKHRKEPELRQDALDGLRRMCIQDSNEYCRIVVQSGGIPVLVSCLKHESQKQVSRAMRCIAKISHWDTCHTDAIVKQGGWTSVIALLKNPLMSDASIDSDALWFCTSLAAGPPEHITVLIRAKAIPTITKKFRRFSADMKKNALYVLTNCISGGTEGQARYVFSSGCITILCSMLNSHDMDVLSAILEALSKLLRITKSSGEAADKVQEVGGLEKLEELAMKNVPRAIYDQTAGIIRKYFDGETDDEREGAPRKQENPFANLALAAIEELSIPGPPPAPQIPSLRPCHRIWLKQ